MIRQLHRKSKCSSQPQYRQTNITELVEHDILWTKYEIQSLCCTSDIRLLHCHNHSSNKQYKRLLGTINKLASDLADLLPDLIAAFLLLEAECIVTVVTLWPDYQGFLHYSHQQIFQQHHHYLYLQFWIHQQFIIGYYPSTFNIGNRIQSML